MIFSSDHGDNFGDDGWQYHFSNVTNAGTKVPLFWLSSNSTKFSIIWNISTKNIFHSILYECGTNTNRDNTIFSESAYSVPILESYWYNNKGKTQEKYKSNKFCFIEQNLKFVYQEGNWNMGMMTNENEPVYESLSSNINPIKEYVSDSERKAYLLDSLDKFISFNKTLSHVQ